MNDNVITTQIVESTSWGVPIIAAFMGATIALIGREIIEWWRRPRLQIDFEKRNESYPYIFDLREESYTQDRKLLSVRGKKYIRFCVFNKGKSAAFGCKTKLEINIPDKKVEGRTSILTWTRTEPRLDEKNTDILELITINRNDREYFNVAHLSFTKRENVTEPKPDLYINFEDPEKRISIGKNVHFQIKIIVSSSNAEPNIFIVNIYWDGTEEGFDKAFTKA